MKNEQNHELMIMLKKLCELQLQLDKFHEKIVLELDTIGTRLSNLLKDDDGDKQELYIS